MTERTAQIIQAELLIAKKAVDNFPKVTPVKEHGPIMNLNHIEVGKNFDFDGGDNKDLAREMAEFILEKAPFITSVGTYDDEVCIYHRESDAQREARIEIERKAQEAHAEKFKAYLVYEEELKRLRSIRDNLGLELRQRERLEKTLARNDDPQYAKYLVLQELMQAKGFID